MKRVPKSGSSRDTLASNVQLSSSSTSAWRNPGANGELLHVQNFPTFLLSRLDSLARSKLTRAYLERARLSMPEWRLLTLIATLSPTTYPDLAQISTMDKGQISMTLRTLVARGWIKWDGAAVNDGARRRRPVRVIAITARGRTEINKIMPDARKMQLRLLELLEEDDRVQLHGLLQKMLIALEALDAKQLE